MWNSIVLKTNVSKAEWSCMKKIEKRGERDAYFRTRRLVYSKVTVSCSRKLVALLTCRPIATAATRQIKPLNLMDVTARNTCSGLTWSACAAFNFRNFALIRVPKAHNFTQLQK
jgi:hypothetical protein